MNSVEIERLISQHLMQWDGFVQKEWSKPNKNFTPTTPIWYRLTILPTRSVMAGMADIPYTREMGMCVIQIFAEENSGTFKVKSIADRLARHLSYHREGLLEMLVANVQEVGHRDGYYQLNINCNYRFN